MTVEALEQDDLYAANARAASDWTGLMQILPRYVTILVRYSNLEADDEHKRLTMCATAGSAGLTSCGHSPITVSAFR